MVPENASTAPIPPHGPWLSQLNSPIDFVACDVFSDPAGSGRVWVKSGVTAEGGATTSIGSTGSIGLG